jgi:WD40 repeat protein/serine/threonine protein kinase
MNEAGSEGDVVDQLAEEFLVRYRRGERPAVQEYAARYPEQAAQIRDLFPALVALERVAPAGDSAPVRSGAAPAYHSSACLPEQVGDYRILREVGRGGMGVVYEAEQETLGRRVALKILHLHAGQDPRLLERFRRESRAAAQLHHTNIVPVFEVGQQDGLCYYAMQFIRGQALDEVFRELCHLRERSAPHAAKGGGVPVSPLVHSLSTMPFEPAGISCGMVEPEPVPEAAVAEMTAAALPDRSELSSVTSNYRRYCRNVARLGLQAAEALAYAHARGIVHRDIKPANLLLDTTGVLWVSDFGLVKTQDPALTDTGDLVGTLRYMAPERFRGECDARADVYALGLTLYELLVLRPAFDGQDRMHLIDQIGHQEPARPRVLDPRIPCDLETILMKAIEKEPQRRYPSAEALAGDLRRFLADEPILARRIGPLERLGRWSRRNPVVAGLSVAVVLVTALGFAGVFGQMQEARANERQAEQKEQEAKKERDQVKALNEKLAAKEQQLQRTLYAAHMNLAHNAWGTGGIGRMHELLEQHRPKPGETDLRGFEWYYLYRLCHGELLTLKGGARLIPADRCVAFSPDGKRLASGSGDNTLKVWDAQTGQELLTFKGHTNTVWSVAFSPDGKRLASASEDNTVKVWDAQTGQELLSLKGLGYSVAFSPDGKRLAICSKVWDAQTGQELLSFKGGGLCVAFSPDGKRLASAGNPTVKLWDAQTGQVVLTLKGHTTPVISVAFSPDGKRLVSGGGLLPGSQGGEVKVWDAQSGQELLSLKDTYRVASVAFSPDGKRLASTSMRDVKVWDAQTGQELLTHKGHTRLVNSVVFSPDGTRLASGSMDETVKVWDATTPPEARTFGGSTGGSPRTVTSVVFSPDGKRLASGSGTWDDTKKAYVAGEVKVWEAQTGQELLALKGHTGRVTSVSFSPDGKRLASASGDRREQGKELPGEVKVWDAQTGQEQLTFKGHSEGVTSVSFSPDGKRLASASGGRRDQGKEQFGEVKVWDAQTGQELLSFKGHTNAIRNVVFGPDGKRLATVARDNTLKVWDAQTGHEILTLKVESSNFGSVTVSFSPDGKRLASGGSGGSVKVWDAQTGQELLALKGHTGQVSSVTFSPDGKRLASASGDEVMVWDAQTGQELLSFKGRVISVVFSPDGHRLASNHGDGTVTIWDATPLPAKP